MGLAVAATVALAWALHLAFLLEAAAADPRAPATYLHVALQAWLSTGLFITAHDAMHGVVAPGAPRLNALVGRVAAWLFAGFSYGRLVANHRRHHARPATDGDPDWHPSGRYLPWLGAFVWRYATAGQVATMAVVYNVLALRYPERALWLWWIAPSVLGTLQLFTFGTYLPHRPPHTAAMGPHRARTQRRNHAWALASCFFFGYHREHHEAPHAPWWQLHRSKPGAARDA